MEKCKCHPPKAKIKEVVIKTTTAQQNKVVKKVTQKKK